MLILSILGARAPLYTRRRELKIYIDMLMLILSILGARAPLYTRRRTENIYRYVNVNSFYTWCPCTVIH